MRLAILVGSKGRGSNLSAIIDACAHGEIGAQVAVVIAPGRDSPAAAIARDSAIDVIEIPYELEGYAEQLTDALTGIDLICLAGYMRLLPIEVVSAWRNRILNIHPALLPKFGGRGMYGIRVQEAVLASGETETGCTVHFVNERYDEGAIVLQMRCPVPPGSTAAELAATVLELEHVAYPRAIQMVIDGLR